MPLFCRDGGSPWLSNEQEGAGLKTFSDDYIVYSFLICLFDESVHLFYNCIIVMQYN